MPKNQLPAGYDNGNTYTSVCINTAIYLPWLVSRCLESGVIFKRAVFDHISEASHVHHSGEKADVTINCTGLSAGKLGGVEDRNMVPARGQIVLVRNEGDGMMYTTSGTDDGNEDVCYTMTRAAGKPQLKLFLNRVLTCRYRWRYYSGWLLPDRQLGFSTRSKSCS